MYSYVHIRYYIICITLLVDSYTSYLFILKVKSRIVDYFQLSNNLNFIPYPTLNRVILVECKVLHHIVLSVAEVEIVEVFYNT